MPIQEVKQTCRERMDKSLEYFDRELRGIRTGRATTALVDYIKVEYYGTPTDLRELAAISVPEPTQLLVKPFDPGGKNDIVKALETADLGLNPQVDGNAIRINIPAPSRERRMQLVNQVKKMAEDARVAIRNERRDAIKQIDQLVKDKENHVSEDEGKDAKSDIDELTKAHTKLIDEHCAKKAEEIEQI
ncbi:MAG: ribosome recycling factor [Phycisphaerales bacterium]|nr:ribosome recycling factor [Phycisphaerales bacterium]NNM25369.1 ribosome recycling factor [Phycisphaerales bacterium]